MRAEIIAVGTEILLGDIVNTNAQYLSRRLADLGISVFRQTVVGDNSARLKQAYAEAFERTDMVIATGGLGPTKDDLTKEAAAEFFKKRLVLHDESLKRIKEYFAKSNRTVNEGNKKQAYMPEGAEILQNNNGTAPGCIIEENGKILVILPGPPKEMSLMFEESVVPYIKKFSDNVLFSKVLRVIGIGEGHMAKKIDDIIDKQTNPTIAPYAKDGEAILRITAKAPDEEKALELIKPVEKLIRERLGDFVYGEDNDNLELVLSRLLIKNNITLSTAESCTGGMIASKLINCPGISSVFMEGAVTYSNDAKMRRLNVKAETLEKYGAVSAETAEEMVRGIAEAAGTDAALSVTGIAGPDGGTPEKPVGLVYVGLYYKGITKVKKLNLSGTREKIRIRTTMEALDFLRREIINN